LKLLKLGADFLTQEAHYVEIIEQSKSDMNQLEKEVAILKGERKTLVMGLRRMGLEGMMEFDEKMREISIRMEEQRVLLRDVRLEREALHDFEDPAKSDSLEKIEQLMSDFKQRTAAFKKVVERRRHVFDDFHAIIKETRETVDRLRQAIRDAEADRRNRSEARIAAVDGAELPDMKRVDFTQPFVGQANLIYDVSGMSVEQIQEDAEKVLHLFDDVRLGFYNMHTLGRVSKVREIIELMKKEFSDRVMTWEGEPGVSLSRLPGVFIQVEGPASESGFDVSTVAPNAVRILKARFVDDQETGLVPITLLLIQKSIERFEDEIVELSMFTKEFKAQVREYYAGLIIARSA